MNTFGTKLRELREKNGLLQRNVAYKLQIDSPMLSKIERGERKAKREMIPVIAKIFKHKEEDLIALWFADQISDLLNGEDVALKAIAIAGNNLKGTKKRNEEL